MSRIDELRELFAYNRWANLRLLDAAAALDDDALARDLGSSFPSVLATFAHIADADWIWLQRWHGVSPGAAPEAWDRSSLDGVRRHWDDVEAGRHAYLAGLDDAALESTIDYRNIAGRAYTSRVDEMLRHVINHSTYHRGQVVTMLRQLGATVQPTDLIAFYRERTPAS